MSDIEVLGNSIAQLDGISVPVALTEQVAIPIAQVSSALKSLHNAIVEAAKKRDQVVRETEIPNHPVADEGEPVLELVPEEGEPDPAE